MGAAISVLLLMARLIIKVHIKAIWFLIKHFDVTNGLIVGSAFQILTENLQIKIWLRVGIVILIIAGSILLQRFFKPVRIVLGVISSAFLGLIAYGAFQGNTSFSPFIPMGIAIGIAATLNVISWFRMDIGNKESDNPA